MSQPPTLPMIPGLSPSNARDPAGDNTHTHAFDFKCGYPIHKETGAVPPAANPTPMNQQAKATVVTHSNPNWLKYDKVVLRFYATIVEAVLERQFQGALPESKRVRKVIIYYYMTTGEIHIEEERVVNSGLAGGRFLNQMIVDGPDGKPLQPKDFVVGQQIAIHGYKFNINDADAQTREFLQATYGIRSAAPTPVAEDDWRRHQRARELEHNACTPKCEITAFSEVAHGGIPKDNLEAARKWIQHSGEVLRFWGCWKDSKEGGRKHEYVVHYFLADDTIEVRNYKQKDGEAGFPLMFRRQRLPKHIPSLKIDGIGSRTDSYITHKDLRIGQPLRVLGRDIMLVCTDSYTIDFYKNTHGLCDADFREVDIASAVPETPAVVIPPPTGYGTEEDSLGSCKRLVPRPPKKNFSRVTKWGNVAARYLARLADGKHCDADRRFVISLFLADDTVAIYEKELKNTGISAGKFLERIRLKNVATGAYFKQEDFVVGQTLKINSYLFEIMESDKANEKLNDDDNRRRDTEFLGAQDAATILRDMSQSTWFKRVGNMTDTFRAIDGSRDAALNQSEFSKWLETYGYSLEQDKISTLFQAFDTNKDGTISLAEFMKHVERYALLSPRGYN